MKKQIPVRADPAYGIAKLLSGLPVAPVWHCDVFQTLLYIGYLTSPPKYRGFDLSTFWAWLRYGAALTNGNGALRLRQSWSDIDPHQKTILADDFGMGFPCQYLIDCHGFEDFANSTYLVETLLDGVVAPARRSLRGPSKSPDFIAVDSAGHLHILECKGTQTSRAYLTDAMRRGIDQKNNLSNASIFKSCMVGGLFVPTANSTENAEIVFIDPPASRLVRALEKLGPEPIARAVRRQSLSKMLSVAGLWTTATALLEKRVESGSISFVRDLIAGEMAFAGYKREEDGFWHKTIEYRDLEQEKDGRRLAVQTRLSIKVPDQVINFVKDVITPTGIVAPAKEIDQWIDERVQASRKERVLTVAPVSQADALPEVKKVRVKSTWDEAELEESENKISTAITSSAGICLSLERSRFA